MDIRFLSLDCWYFRLPLAMLVGNPSPSYPRSLKGLPMPIIEFVFFLLGLAAIFVISYSRASFWIRALSVTYIALLIHNLVIR